MLSWAFKALVISGLIFTPEIGVAQSKATKTKQKKTAKGEDRFTKQFNKAKRDYRLGNIDDRKMWEKLSKMYRGIRKAGLDTNPSDLLQTQAFLINKGDYPLLSAKYAAWALISSKNPYDKKMRPSWELLDKIAANRQIHDVLIELAENIVPSKKPPPFFKRNWYYFLGEAYLNKEEPNKAIASFNKLQVADRYFLASRYQLAMTHLFFKEDTNKAGLVLRSIISDELATGLSISKRKRRRYMDHAHLALGRIQYERQKFASATKYFRKVQRTSPLYYRALFDQSWAFFLAGFPNHALGSLHSVESPFFPGRFNPEVSVLRSVIYYWLCRYEDAQVALAEFIEKYQKPVDQLEKFLANKSLKPERAYKLFENLIAGVNSKALGINRELLDHVAKTSPMVYERDRYATVLAETERLKLKGIFRSKKYNRVALGILGRWEKQIQKELGEIYIAELTSLRDDYRRFRAQANFIFIELLMSEKEQALGRELHADAKIDNVSQSLKARGWGRASVPWKGDSKGEYWWDEVGFYIYQVEPRCKEAPESDGG